MSYGIKLWVGGARACFTRPEMKAERVSYDVITPSAARGILEAIHWKPAIRWIVDRIHVLKPIRFENIRRNEVGSKITERAERRLLPEAYRYPSSRSTGIAASAARPCAESSQDRHASSHWPIARSDRANDRVRLT